MVQKKKKLDIAESALFLYWSIPLGSRSKYHRNTDCGANEGVAELISKKSSPIAVLLGDEFPFTGISYTLLWMTNYHIP